MSDIVKRLRDPSSGSPRWLDTMQEAAARIAELEAEVARLREPDWIVVLNAQGRPLYVVHESGEQVRCDYARGFAAAREAAAAALSRLTAQWPHVGPVPPTVRGEWALRDKALPAIRAIRPEEPSA